VRSSHERWDGTGYPDRLAGTEIPLGARVVAVADAFAAMTARRPYRPARTADEAVEELRACAGSQFDADVVEAFVTARAHHALTAVA
jgi:HD-GYP domain-containing protein (c-di-GMP phosphodiesterase class II)